MHENRAGIYRYTISLRFRVTQQIHARYCSLLVCNSQPFRCRHAPNIVNCSLANPGQARYTYIYSPRVEDRGGMQQALSCHYKLHAVVHQNNWQGRKTTKLRQTGIMVSRSVRGQQYLAIGTYPYCNRAVCMQLTIHNTTQEFSF